MVPDRRRFLFRGLGKLWANMGRPNGSNLSPIQYPSLRHIMNLAFRIFLIFLLGGGEGVRDARKAIRGVGFSLKIPGGGGSARGGGAEGPGGCLRGMWGGANFFFRDRNSHPVKFTTLKLCRTLGKACKFVQSCHPYSHAFGRPLLRMAASQSRLPRKWGGGPKVRHVPRNQGNQTFLAGYPGIFAGISRRCPKSLMRKKSLCSIFVRYS